MPFSKYNANSLYIGRMGNLLRIKLSYNLLILGIITSLVLTLKLWIPPQEIPAFGILPQFPNAVNYTLVGLFLLCLIVLLIYKKWFVFPVLGLLLFIFLVLQDINRFQPWVYHYSLLWIPFLLYPVHYYKFKPWEPVLNFQRLLLMGIFLWSGIQKLNAAYFEGISAYLTSGLETSLGVPHESLQFLAWIAPFLQIIGAIGLLTPTLRNWGILLLTIIQLMGILLIAVLNKWNYVIIPWNLVIVGFLWLLFYNTKERWNDFSLGKMVGLKLVLTVVLLMPLVGKFTKLPYPVQFKLYSEFLEDSHLYLLKEDNDFSQFPSKAVRSVGSYEVINLQYWASEVYNAPLYQSNLNYEIIETEVSKIYPNTKVFLTISSSNDSDTTEE
ncbi:MAG: hypothetical protein CL843_14590 [Crocinitomicaceae bacterium]|nr:hypothetical protein [Crocinitomicaceae bacterium]